MSRFSKFLEAAKRVETWTGLLTSEWAKYALWPIGVSVVTFVSGLFSAVPLPYLIAAAVFVAAGTASLLLRLTQWRILNDTSSKLVFGSLLVGANISDDKKNLASVQMGLVLHNKAFFPIFFEIEEMESDFVGRVSRTERIPFRMIEVPPGGDGYWRDRSIDFDTPVGFNALEGHFKFRLRYTSNKRSFYYIQRRLKVYLTKQPDSDQFVVSSSEI